MITNNQDNKFPRLYLALLGLVALLIVTSSTSSFIHEKETYALISIGNIEAGGFNLAKEIEQQGKQSALEYFQKDDLIALADRFENTVSGNLAFTAKVREISEKHPIAEDLFLLVDGSLYSPQLKVGKPYLPLTAINNESPPEERSFADLYQKAEKESSRQDYESAIELLEKCTQMEVSDELKSHGLDLLARVYIASNNPTNAARIWNRLEDQYPNYLNEYHVPYALAAAIEIDELDAGSNTNRKDTLRSLYTDLLDGRWILSEEVVLQLKNRLEKRLGYATPEIEDSPFLNRFQTARIVRESLNGIEKPSDSEGIHSTILQEPEKIQLFYKILSGNGPQRILVMSVNNEWIQKDLLSRSYENLHSPIKAISKFKIQPTDTIGNPDLQIPFNEIFTFFELRMPEGAVSSSQFNYKLQLAIIALTAIITLTLLVLIMFLIVRITRERMAIKIKTDFLSHVSHELKTPLTLIQLYTETLLTDETLPEEDQKYSLKVISKESTHLLNLIENLLQLSATENTTEKFKLTTGDIGQTIEKTARACIEWLRKQDIELKIQVAPGLPLVRFDSEQITRTFLNLIDNARKYGGNSTSIEVGLWSEQNKVILEVRDHGPGIPVSEQKMVFDQFYRGGEKAENRGVGLGLYIINKTMKAHNGTVVLETEPGKGSAFKLIFPVSR